MDIFWIFLSCQRKIIIHLSHFLKLVLSICFDLVLSKADCISRVGISDNLDKNDDLMTPKWCDGLASSNLDMTIYDRFMTMTTTPHVILIKWRFMTDLWQWRQRHLSFWILNDDDDDARCHWKKWRRHDDLAVTVNDAAPWNTPIYPYWPNTNCVAIHFYLLITLSLTQWNKYLLFCCVVYLNLNKCCYNISESYFFLCPCCCVI